MNTHGEERFSAEVLPAFRRAVLAVCVFCAVVAMASLLQQQQSGGVMPQQVSGAN